MPDGCRMDNLTGSSEQRNSETVRQEDRKNRERGRIRGREREGERQKLGE